MKAYLVCYDDVIGDDGDLCCKRGSRYEVIEVSKSKYSIINALGETQWFDNDEYDDAYFGQWFNIVLG